MNEPKKRGRKKKVATVSSEKKPTQGTSLPIGKMNPVLSSSTER